MLLVLCNRAEEYGHARSNGVRTQHAKRRIRRSGRSSKSKAALATLQCSIWRSTASFVAVTSSPSASRMSPPVGARRIEQRSDRKNRAARQIWIERTDPPGHRARGLIKLGKFDSGIQALNLPGSF